MKKPKVQQKTERRISAALRLGLVAVLLLELSALMALLFAWAAKRRLRQI